MFADPPEASTIEMPLGRAMFDWQSFFVPNNPPGPSISSVVSVSRDRQTPHGGLPLETDVEVPSGSQESRMEWWRSCGETAVLSG